MFKEEAHSLSPPADFLLSSSLLSPFFRSVNLFIVRREEKLKSISKRIMGQE
jgi:hypothetical protein